jgi:hypothetical protein
LKEACIKDAIKRSVLQAAIAPEDFPAMLRLVTASVCTIAEMTTLGSAESGDEAALG